MRLRRKKSRRGSILTITMIILLIAAFAATGLAGLALFELRDVARYEVYKNEFEVAEAVLAKVFAEVTFLVEYAGPNLTTEIANVRPPTVAGYTVRNLAIQQLSDGFETITQPGSPWRGLQLHIMRYRVTAQVHQNSNTSKRLYHPGVELSQDLELRYIPLYVFAIFYDSDLEIHPGAAMVVTGRVHSNANIYVGSDGAGLALKDFVTAVGQILHMRKPQSGMTLRSGVDTIYDGNTDVPMWEGTSWVDHLYPNWANVALSRWSDHVFDAAHLVMELNPPVPRLEDSSGKPNTHALIERANPSSPDEQPGSSLRQEKFEYKAGLKIVRDPATGLVRGFDQNGGAVDLTYPNPDDPQQTKSVYRESTFYDAREQKTVASIDVNIGNLIESGKAPENGILYLSNEGTAGVVRVANASRLPTNVHGGFTIASDDPVYVRGDFNTTNKEYALIAADAITVLSNNWQDSRSGSYDLRTVVPTTYNAVFFQGIVPSQTADGVNHYSGGVENYFRLLERWDGNTMTVNGSLICVWESQKARGWWGQGQVYSPPRRVWAWDSMYMGTNGPPGTPRVYHVLRRHWNVRSLSPTGS